MSTLLPAHATILTFNSATSSSGDIAAARDGWLSAIGISAPTYLVDFESGFSDEQNISGSSGLFGLIGMSRHHKRT